MANIQHWLDQIRRAIYGREVRSSIADAIEAINKDCEGTGIKQEQLEQTFDQLIINAGNSNAEIVAARVDKKGQQHQTLGDRLNATDDAVEKNAEKITDLEKEIERIDNRFSNIYYLADYIEDTNIINNIAIGQLVDEINANPNPVQVIFNVPKLILTKPVFFNRGNIKIDFNYCNIIFQHDGTLTNDNNLSQLATDNALGVFNFKGTADIQQGCKVKEFVRLNLNDGVKGIFHGKITLNIANPAITEGSFLYLDLLAQDGNNQVLGVEKPIIRKLVQVMNKLDDTNFIVNYAPNWDLKNLDAINANSILYKVEPLTNIKIKGFLLHDENNYNFGHDDVITPDAAKESINALNFEYCDIVNINNIEVFKSTGNGIKFDKCSNLIVEDIFFDEPTIKSAGRGYNLKIAASNEIYVRKSISNKARHTVDFSCSSNGRVYDSNGQNDAGSSFLTHGIYEHDILFNNCKGSFTTGANVSIGTRSDKITYKNCKMNNYFSGFGKNVTIEKSLVMITNPYVSTNFPNLYKSITFNNSEVLLKNGDYYGYNGAGDNTDRKMIFNDCKVIFMEYTTFNDFEKVLFNNCEINTLENRNVMLELRKVVDFKISNGSVLRNVTFSLNNNYKNLTLDSVLIENDSNFDIISAPAYSAESRTIKLTDVTYVYHGTSNKRFLVVRGQPGGTINEAVLISDCKIKSVTPKALESFTFFSTASIADVVVANNNVFDNLKTDGDRFTKKNYPNNIFLNM